MADGIVPSAIQSNKRILVSARTFIERDDRRPAWGGLGLIQEKTNIWAISLRVNLTALWQVEDVVRARSTLQNFVEFVYKELQFALREAIGSRTLDELLGAKGDLDREIQGSARGKIEQHGIRLASVGIKDVILPGEMKEILNRVVEAEKVAQANLIKRRRALFMAAAGCRIPAMSTSPEIFQFEKDYAGALYCIPMVVRRKLDLCGVKVSLKQWNRFDLGEREQLVAQGCETPNEVDDYGRYVSSVIENRTHEPAQLLERDAGVEWNDTKSVPQRVVDYSIERDVRPPTVAQWAALTPLQRFSIFKLTRPGHSNENFEPAMREFGLI